MVTCLEIAFLLTPLALGVALVTQGLPEWLVVPQRSAEAQRRRLSLIGMGLTVGWSMMLYAKELTVALLGPDAFSSLPVQVS